MLVNGSDFYCGNSASNPLQLALKSMIPDVSGFAMSSDLESLKTSVSSGKSIIASAVTGKGVSTAADASFQTIANNINSIYQLYTGDANATAGDISSGKSAYVNGVKIVGTASVLKGSGFQLVASLTSWGDSQTYQLDTASTYLIVSYSHTRNTNGFSDVDVHFWNNGVDNHIRTNSHYSSNTVVANISSSGFITGPAGYNASYPAITDILQYK